MGEELLQQEYYQQEQIIIKDDGIVFKDSIPKTLEEARVLRRPRNIYGYALALDDKMLFPQIEEENYNIFNYADSIKVDDTYITKPEGYEADNNPITAEEAADLLHASPTDPADLDKLLNNFQEIHLKSGTIIYSEAYFEEHIKPSMSEEELARVKYIDREETKNLLTSDKESALDMAEAEDKYGSANVDDIVNSKEYQKDFDEWAAHMDEDATALELAEKEENISEAEAEHFKDLDI